MQKKPWPATCSHIMQYHHSNYFVLTKSRRHVQWDWTSSDRYTSLWLVFAFTDASLKKFLCALQTRAWISHRIRLLGQHSVKVPAPSQAVGKCELMHHQTDVVSQSRSSVGHLEVQNSRPFKTRPIILIVIEVYLVFAWYQYYVCARTDPFSLSTILFISSWKVARCREWNLYTRTR